ncbi:MAG: energy transducer TonB [Bacteroidetes bacterium]|nr:energy transducer TonB [Bacteroidota bacterium]MBU1719864.1 energy transducer TonB [Bacteroidota bacterium]
MKPKKSPAADLEPKKKVFALIGLVVALAIVLSAFEWGVTDKREIISGNNGVSVEDTEIAPITITPPDPPKKIIAPTTFEIAPDDTKSNDEFKANTEIDVNDVVAPPTLIIVETPPEIVNEVEIVYDFPSIYPEYMGGTPEMYKFLKKNTVYPGIAKDANISGTVYVQFVVGKDGKISGVAAMNRLGGGCEEEAVRVVSIMPAWKPGEQMGKKVAVRYKIPVKFVLKN